MDIGIKSLCHHFVHILLNSKQQLGLLSLAAVWIVMRNVPSERYVILHVDFLSILTPFQMKVLMTFIFMMSWNSTLTLCGEVLEVPWTSQP